MTARTAKAYSYGASPAVAPAVTATTARERTAATAGAGAHGAGRVAANRAARTASTDQTAMVVGRSAPAQSTAATAVGASSTSAAAGSAGRRTSAAVAPTVSRRAQAAPVRRAQAAPVRSGRCSTAGSRTTAGVPTATAQRSSCRASGRWPVLAQRAAAAPRAATSSHGRAKGAAPSCHVEWVPKASQVSAHWAAGAKKAYNRAGRTGSWARTRVLPAMPSRPRQAGECRGSGTVSAMTPATASSAPGTA
ncbi:hypothetical protein ASC99_32450 [Kitasatospora sp. Root107]|nr:hypothetical protein ASC99_32450 [Kitasatospora sp. Root107]